MTLADRLGEKVANSRAGRIVLTVAIVLLVVFTAAWNLPPGAGPSSSGGSALRREVMLAGAPVMYALGLDQDWAVFAPPRTRVLNLYAKITFTNGTKTVWHPPTSTGALFGAYRDYRWGKYIEMVIAESSTALWEPLAAWIARQHTSRGRRPSVVTIVWRYYEILVATAGAPSRGPWTYVTAYVYHVPASSQ